MSNGCRFRSEYLCSRRNQSLQNMIPTYIITGANGHVAQTVIHKLKNTNSEIRGLILPSEYNVDTDNVKYYKGDITRPYTMQDIFSGIDGPSTVVIHAAGIITIEDEITTALYNVNVVGTRNVIDACRKYGIGRLVYVSSVHAIEEGDGLHVIREMKSFSKDKVVGAYAKTKAEATQSVMEAIEAGMDAVVVHPSGILGPGDDGRNHLTQLIQSYMCGKLLGGVTGGYDFVDVRDVADGIIAAAERGRKGECYILSNRFIPIPDLMKYLQKVTGGKKTICFPLGLAKMMAPLFEWIGRVTGRRPLFTRYSLRTMASNGRFCHDKATIELGYSPRDMMETVRDTVAYLQTGVLAR